MRWGVIGYGSIGTRHVQNILKLQDECFVLTKNQDCQQPRVQSISELLSQNCDAIIISNPTALHAQTYIELRRLNQNIPLLIEKPIFDRSQQINNAMAQDTKAFVAYCFRYHPLIEQLISVLQNQRVLSAQFYVGQYLPTWRPGRDYSQTYSAKKSEGGGVLRDLSHEIDMASYILGRLQLHFSFSQKLSQLMIDSDDTYLGVFSTEKCPLISIQMNYLDHIKQRFILLQTDEATIKVDFISGFIQTNEHIFQTENSKTDMYLAMLEDFKAQKSNRQSSRLCTFEQGLRTLQLIEESEKRSL